MAEHEPAEGDSTEGADSIDPEEALAELTEAVIALGQRISQVEQRATEIDRKIDRETQA